MPFIGGNLLLSHSFCIKTVQQATSYEKTSTISLGLPVAAGQRPQHRGEAAQGESLRRAALKGFLSQNREL